LLNGKRLQGLKARYALFHLGLRYCECFHGLSPIEIRANGRIMVQSR
jgi:hypothetical protein